MLSVQKKRPPIRIIEIKKGQTPKYLRNAAISRYTVSIKKTMEKIEAIIPHGKEVENLLETLNMASPIWGKILPIEKKFQKVQPLIKGYIADLEQLLSKHGHELPKLKKESFSKEITESRETLKMIEFLLRRINHKRTPKKTSVA